MFYHDRESMIDMYEESLSKNNFKYVLLTTHISSGDITTKELKWMHNEWKIQMSNFIHSEDAAHLINKGNIFVILHKNAAEEFMYKSQNLIFESTKGNGHLKTSLQILSQNESDFLFKCLKGGLL